MSIQIDNVSNSSVKSVSNKQITGKISASDFKFKKSGEFRINGKKISVRKGDNLENIVKKINRSSSGVKAELVKGKSGAQIIELKSKKAVLRIDDRKSGIIGELYQAGQIKRVDKNSRIEYLGKEEIDSSNYLNNLLTGKIKATLANAASSNPAPKANIADELEAQVETDESEAEVEAQVEIDEAEGEVEAQEVPDEAAAEVEAQAQALLVEQALAQQQVAAFKAQQQAQAIALHNQQVAIQENFDRSQVIALDAVTRVIQKHKLINTIPAYRQGLIDLITNNINTKNFNTNAVLINQGDEIATVLAEKMSKARDWTASAIDHKLGIPKHKLNEIVQWIQNLH